MNNVYKKIYLLLLIFTVSLISAQNFGDILIKNIYFLPTSYYDEIVFYNNFDNVSTIEYSIINNDEREVEKYSYILPDDENRRIIDNNENYIFNDDGLITFNKYNEERAEHYYRNEKLFKSIIYSKLNDLYHVVFYIYNDNNQIIEVKIYQFNQFLGNNNEDYVSNFVPDSDDFTSRYEKFTYFNNGKIETQISEGGGVTTKKMYKYQAGILQKIIVDVFGDIQILKYKYSDSELPDEIIGNDFKIKFKYTFKE